MEMIIRLEEDLERMIMVVTEVFIKAKLYERRNTLTSFHVN